MINESDPVAQHYFESQITTITVEQCTVFDSTLQSIENNNGGFYFIDAPAGTGKTYIPNLFLSYVRKQHGIAIGTATSGFAGTLLQKGTTTHSHFKLPFSIFEDSMCNISLNSHKAQVLKSADIIIVDEVSLLHYHSLDVIHRFLCVLMNNNLLFGGKTVITCGDYRQMLPVIPRGSRAHIVQARMHSSDLWKHVQKQKLTRNMRLEKLLHENSSEEERNLVLEFGEWLLEVGEGRVQHVIPGTNIIKLDDSLGCNTPQEVFDTVYANMESNIHNLEYFKERAILCSTNETVNKANEKLLKKLSTPSAHCHSIDTVLNPDQAAAFQTEFLNSIEYSGIPQHHLHLKKGAVILLMRNLDVKQSHCNGSRYIIEDITQRLIIAK